MEDLFLFTVIFFTVQKFSYKGWAGTWRPLTCLPGNYGRTQGKSSVSLLFPMSLTYSSVLARSFCLLPNQFILVKRYELAHSPRMPKISYPHTLHWEKGTTLFSLGICWLYKSTSAWAKSSTCNWFSSCSKKNSFSAFVISLIIVYLALSDEIESIHVSAFILCL